MKQYLAWVQASSQWSITNKVEIKVFNKQSVISGWETQGFLKKYLPIDTLSNQTSRSQYLLDVSQPVGSLQFAKPAVHIVRLVITSFHEFDEAFLQNIKPVGKGKCYGKHKH